MSFQNIITKWIPEVTHHCPTAAIVIVGTKEDMRHSADFREESAARGRPVEYVNIDLGDEVRKK